MRDEADLLTALAPAYEKDGTPPLCTLLERAGVVGNKVCTSQTSAH
ncbi:hypothetical protein [Streptomyces chartreusis]